MKIRKLKCKHEWEKKTVEKIIILTGMEFQKTTYICKKCGKKKIIRKVL